MTGDGVDKGSWARHPDLSGVGASMRAEWRDQAELENADAATDHQHGQGILDRLVECMHRGDRVELCVGPHHVVGIVDDVGPDMVAVRTFNGRVDAHLHPSVPMTVRIDERAVEGGHGPSAGSGDFRRALIARESVGAEVTLGTTLDSEPLDGRLVVGRDHVVLVGRGGAEMLVPLASTAYVRARRD